MRWICMTSRNPRDGQAVLITNVSHGHPIVSAVEFDCLDHWWATHWMPFPEPPTPAEVAIIKDEWPDLCGHNRIKSDCNKCKKAVTDYNRLWR